MRRCTDICRCAGVCRCIGVRRCAGVRRCEECFLRRSNPGFDFYKKATFDKSRSLDCFVVKSTPRNDERLRNDERPRNDELPTTPSQNTPSPPTAYPNPA